MENENIASIFEGIGINNRAEKLFVLDRVSRALTDPNPIYRSWAVNSLQRAYPDLTGVFAEDNQTFVSFGNNLETTTYYVGDLPKKQGEYPQTYSFDAELKTQIPNSVEFVFRDKNLRIDSKHEFNFKPSVL